MGVWWICDGYDDGYLVCIWWVCDGYDDVYLMCVGEGSGSWVDDGGVDGDCDVASDGDEDGDGCLKYMNIQL